MSPTTMNELEKFLQTWDMEAKNTVKLLESLPADKYEFRPDPQGRSLGELAWHIAEVDAYPAYGIEVNKVDFSRKPPNIERPRDVKSLAPGFKRVHEQAVAIIRKLKPEDMNREIEFFGGRKLRIGDILWGAQLYHTIHHRGQLALMCRLAGGVCPPLYGPNREEMAAMRAASGGNN